MSLHNGYTVLADVAQPLSYQCNHNLSFAKTLTNSDDNMHVKIVSFCCLGDWHIAYLLLYSPLRLEKFKEEEQPEGAGEKSTATVEEPMDTTQSAGDDKPASP